VFKGRRRGGAPEGVYEGREDEQQEINHKYKKTRYYEVPEERRKKKSITSLTSFKKGGGRGLGTKQTSKNKQIRV